MCGIAGLWRITDPQPEDARRVERMAASLAHRGPDDCGYLLASTAQGLARAGREIAAGFTPDLLMASRRLSITDLTAAGRQPLANEAGDVFVVFNGAIHNHVELRAELQARGHVFRSQTDTEVIVHAYEQWGEDCARRFNGMWAYVIWDGPRRRLVCSRDRFGIKPLLVAWRADAFYFASEAKAILASGGVPAVANPAFVRRFLSSGMPAHGRQTAFEGIEQVPAGCNLVVTREGRRESPYWSYADRSAAYDFSRPEQTFRELFADAVRLRLRADVPLGILLSGGLDSSSVAVHARRQAPGGAPEAFTATFPGYAGDERRHAEVVAAHSGIRLHCVEIDPSNLLQDLASVTWHMDMPPAHGQVIARWQLLAAASRRVRVVLEGQGADELLAGYFGRYRKAYLDSELDQLRAANFARKLPLLAAVTLAGVRQRLRAHLPGARAASGSKLGKRIVSPALAAQAGPAWQAAETPPSGTDFPDHLTTALHRDHAHLILPHLLHFGDAISMAHGVESRVPFLDHRLVEFVFALPFDWKLRGTQTKYILRKAFEADLPAATLRRRDKVGFGTPVQQWLASGFREEIRPLLTSDRARARGILDPAGLEHSLAAFEAGREGAASVVFRCLALELWFRLFVDGDGFRDRPGLAAISR